MSAMQMESGRPAEAGASPGVADAPFAPLFARLVAREGVTLIDDAAALQAFAAAGDSVTLLTDAPARCPEAWDLAVVFPELLRCFPGRLRAAVADPTVSASLIACFAITRLPALLFQRDGGYVGVLEGMRDWQGFAAEFGRMLAQPLSRVPGVGIPVRPAQTPSCQ